MGICEQLAGRGDVNELIAGQLDHSAARKQAQQAQKRVRIDLALGG